MNFGESHKGSIGVRSPSDGMFRGVLMVDIPPEANLYFFSARYLVLTFHYIC